MTENTDVTMGSYPKTPSGQRIKSAKLSSKGKRAFNRQQERERSQTYTTKFDGMNTGELAGVVIVSNKSMAQQFTAFKDKLIIYIGQMHGAFVSRAFCNEALVKMKEFVKGIKAPVKADWSEYLISSDGTVTSVPNPITMTALLSMHTSIITATGKEYGIFLKVMGKTFGLILEQLDEGVVHTLHAQEGWPAIEANSDPMKLLLVLREHLPSRKY